MLVASYYEVNNKIFLYEHNENCGEEEGRDQNFSSTEKTASFKGCSQNITFLLLVSFFIMPCSSNVFLP